MRIQGFDTDRHRCTQMGHRLTQMHADGTQIFFIFFISVTYLCYPRLSVVICGYLWLSVVSRGERLRLIIDCMRKNGGKEQNGLRKYSVCAAAQAANVYSYKHKPRIAGEPAISLSRFRDWKPFFVQEQFYIAEPCYLGLTQMDSDAYVPLAQTSITSAYANGAQATYALRWDTDDFLFIICASSVCITVHLWFHSPACLPVPVWC